MFIRILGDSGTLAYGAAEALTRRLGHSINGNRFYYDIAIAPLLTSKISNFDLIGPSHGTLIFHPSPLPYGRGPSSIKWAYSREEPITAATWFWANDKFDAGDICEMEIIKIDYSISPRSFYETHVIPAMERTLERCLNDLQRGVVRRIPQVELYASYDKRM